ncbi:MAG: Uma2 family endonuclease [Proteobacteria bacterium]|nr:Uma2 family endonuclease [Pseudomonadota bacterium]
MSALPKTAPNLYDELCDLPPHVTGEIIGGQLHTQPRPAGPHSLSSSTLGGELYGHYQRGSGGPGGWWIIDEPEIHFIRDVEVCVPDIAGWRKERMPKIPRGHRFEIVPDWVCEVLSPSTAKKDRVVKMPVYAQYGVGFLWLVDPLERTLEAFALSEGRWTVVGLFQDKDIVQTTPFEEMALNLEDLWAEVEEGDGSFG